MTMTNVVAEGHAFRKWAQTLNETVLQYVTAVPRELASTCDFGDCQDDMIRDQLVDHYIQM